MYIYKKTGQGVSVIAVLIGLHICVYVWSRPRCISNRFRFTYLCICIKAGQVVSVIAVLIGLHICVDQVVSVITLGLHICVCILAGQDIPVIAVLIGLHICVYVCMKQTKVS